MQQLQFSFSKAQASSAGHSAVEVERAGLQGPPSDKS